MGPPILFYVFLQSIVPWCRIRSLKIVSIPSQTNKQKDKYQWTVNGVGATSSSRLIFALELIQSKSIKRKCRSQWAATLSSVSLESSLVRWSFEAHLGGVGVWFVVGLVASQQAWPAAANRPTVCSICCPKPGCVCGEQESLMRSRRGCQPCTSS